MLTIAHAVPENSGQSPAGSRDTAAAGNGHGVGLGHTDHESHWTGYGHGLTEGNARPDTSAHHEPARPTAPMLTVLMVEDNAVSQLLGLRLLERQGHKVTAASNGRQALDILKHGSFDVILMDLQMPELDGFDATARIREAERGSARHQVIVAMTANTLKSDLERCRDVGMDGYLAKPISPEGLAAVLTEVRARLGKAH